jgi:carbon monoxide dehydrogenase subunit G
MRVTGAFAYAVPPAVVYALFTERAALLQAVPGLEQLEETGPDRFDARLKLGWGNFAVLYGGTVTVTDRHPGEGFRLQVDATTEGGYGKADARFRFLPAGDGGTRVEYDAEIELGGGQTLWPFMTRAMADYFLHGMAEVMKKRRLERRL